MATDTVTIRISPEARDILKTQGKTYTQTILSTFQNANTNTNTVIDPTITDTKIGPLSRNSGKVQGVVFLSQAGHMFTSPPITVQKIKELLTNPYIASKLEKRALTFFPDRLLIEALDPKQNVDEEVTHTLQNMCSAEDVRLNERVLQADSNSYSYGMAFYNPVWVRRGGEIYIQQLRHLPAWSFDTMPLDRGISEVWSELLEGVIVNETTGEPEYWQRINNSTLETEQISNILTIKNPKDEGLAGNSKLIPLVQIIEMLKYCWNTDMQAIHRAGSPIFFLKITNPRSAEDPSTGGVSDVDYGNMIISGWNKDKQYQLRENMEIISLPLSSEIDVLRTHDVLKAVIDDYFSISNMISKDGTLIGGSSIPELKLLNQAIRGLHNWILAPFETLLNKYFILNGFPDGWTVRLTIPLWEEDRTEQKLKAAETGIKGQCVDLDDLRELLQLEPADEKKKKSIEEFWKRNQPVIPEVQIPKKEEVPGNEEIPEEEEMKEKTQKEHIHEGEGEEINPISEVTSKKLNEQIDRLAKEIIKAVEA